MSILDRFGSSGSGKEADLVHAYLAAKNEYESLRSGTAAKYVIVGMNQSGEFLPIFDPERLDEIRSMHKKTLDAKDKVDKLLASIVAVDAYYEENEIQEIATLRRLLKNMQKEVERSQLVPAVRKQKEKRYAEINNHIDTTSKLLEVEA
jgi:hypothetical protein